MQRKAVTLSGECVLKYSFTPEVGINYVVMCELQAVALKGLIRAGQALHANHGVLAAVDQDDVAVAPVYQVLRQFVKGGDVVERDVAYVLAAQLRVYGDAGPAADGQGLAVRVGGLEPEEYGAGDVVLIAELLIALLQLGRGVYHIHRYVYVVLRGELVDALHEHRLEVVEHGVLEKAREDQGYALHVL